MTILQDYSQSLIQLCRAQSFPVTLPDGLTCEDCTVRLVRQAGEWSSSYLFWSCADVSVVAPGQYREDCSGGRGRALAGRCRCHEPRFYGDRCQYEDDCAEDKDCGRHGRCVDVRATTAPRKVCYCQAGFHGKFCDRGKLRHRQPRTLS